MFLSFFSEIGKTKSRRRLILSALSYACEDKNDNSYNVGEHLEYFLHSHAKSGDEQIGNVKSAEKHRAEYTDIRLPDGEYNARDREPSTFDYRRAV